MSNSASAPDGASSTFIPRRHRQQSEREEALLAGLQASLEGMADLQEQVATLLHIVALLLGLRVRDRHGLETTEKALTRIVGAVVEFDARCADGDVIGAAAELRAWLGKVMA